MRKLLLSTFIAIIAFSGAAFFNVDTALAGGTAEFNSVSFACPNIVNTNVNVSISEETTIYLRGYDPDTGTLLFDEFNTFTTSQAYIDSFTLSDPLPENVTVQSYIATSIAVYDPSGEKSAGFAALFNPPSMVADLGSAPSPPSLPGGYIYTLQESRTFAVPDCTTLDSCSVSVPVYGMALVTKAQVMYSGPNGDVVKDENGVPLPLLHDVDGDGADTYLIIDIATGAEGETWLGLFIGACDPVYVELQNVFPLGAIPVD